MDKITLKLNKENYPQLLKRYSLENIKKMAIDMALAQYTERPVTEEMMYSCLTNYEISLEEMFG